MLTGIDEIRKALEPELEKNEIVYPPLVATHLAGGGILLPSAETPIRDASQHVFKRMAETNRFFWRGGAVHEISEECLSPIKSDAMRTRIESLGATVTIQRDGKDIRLAPRRPSEADCKAILASVEAAELLPSVEIIAKAPMLFLTDSGPIRAKGGYCKEAEAYITGRHSEVEISAKQAADEIEDLFRDFAFVSEGDRARAFAFCITVALRLGGFIHDDRCPLFVVEADQSQTGKGTLIDAVCSIYGERPELVGEKAGGVGGFDESIQQRLIDGAPIILLDNLRGRVASAYLEMILTAPGRIGCRVPHRGEIYVDPHRFIFCATSNGMQSTRDLANRSCIIRLRKRKEDYRFHTWPDGGLIDHCRLNQARLLAGVHAIIQDWYNAGAVKADVFGHDFRGWHTIIEGIVSHAWPKVGPVIDAEHKESIQRISDPAKAWLREICQAVDNNAELCASGIVELSSLNGLTVPGCREDDNDSKAAKAVGVAMKRVFGNEHSIVIDGILIERFERQVKRENYGNNRLQKIYRFTKHSTTAPTAPTP